MPGRHLFEGGSSDRQNVLSQIFSKPLRVFKRPHWGPGSERRRTPATLSIPSAQSTQHASPGRKRAHVSQLPVPHVFYVAPCGRRCRDMRDVAKYLQETGSLLSLDHFTFCIYIDPFRFFETTQVTPPLSLSSLFFFSSLLIRTPSSFNLLILYLYLLYIEISAQRRYHTRVGASACIVWCSF